MPGIIRRLPNRRYQADIADRARGIPRTRRTFDTRAQAREWLAAVSDDAHDRLLGGRGRYLFGTALARYLTEVSPAKRSHATDITNARTLRYPYWDADARTFRALELMPLTDTPEGIVAGLAAWSADRRGVEARSYVLGNHYERRAGTWWHQPDPGPEGTRPRVPVTDPATLAAIARAAPRGPYSSGTLRARQILARRVLTVAWRRWRLTDQDLARMIDLDKPAPGRQTHLTGAQLTALLIAAPPHIDDAILAAAWIGWRRANLLGLTWDRVVFPVRQGDTEIQPGYLWYTADQSKNARPLLTPMARHIGALLLARWTLRTGPLVFHDGGGRPLGDIRKPWARAIAAANAHGAGIPPGLRWHDLRHTWASLLLAAGASDAELQALGNWKDAAMVRRYAHLRTEHLRNALERITQ